MFYSEGGQSNGHISQRLIDTGLNHSASIPMWSGDPPVQLQGLTVCGSVTAGRHNWIFLKFYLHFWPALEPCKRATIKDIDFIFPVRTRPTLTCPPCKYEGMDIHSSSTVVCQIWGQFRWNLVLYGSKCPILKRVHETARSPFGLWIQHCILQGRFQYDRAIYLSSYNVWPYAGQSQLDAKLNILEILTHFWTAAEPCGQAAINDMDFMFPVPSLHSHT